MTKRIAATMRVSHDNQYGELRDALAQDWHRFFQEHLPEVRWVSVPNTGEGHPLDFCETWQIDAVVLTGGNDLGECIERDETEHRLFKNALTLGIPILGICRGAQLVYQAMGGVITQIPGGTHAGQSHEITYIRDYCNMPVGSVREVNSYHHWGLSSERCPQALLPFAATDDGFIEGFSHQTQPILGMMWHPERHSPADINDVAMIRQFLGLKQKVLCR